MGRFFQIVQTQDSTFFVNSCDPSSSDICEMLQVGNTPVVYQFSGASERLSWQSNGFFFSLFRSAGEPGKVYKDDLLRIVESMDLTVFLELLLPSRTPKGHTYPARSMGAGHRPSGRTEKS
jgi:hypothetical protein